MANIRGGNPNKARLLTAARFLGGGDLIPVEIPEITNADGEASIVLLKQPSAARILGWQAALKEGQNEGNAMMFNLIAESAVDEQGNRLFSEADAPNLGQILEISAFLRISKALMELASAVSMGAGTADDSGNAPSGVVEAAGLVQTAPQVELAAPESTAGSDSPTSSPSV